MRKKINEKSIEEIKKNLRPKEFKEPTPELKKEYDCTSPLLARAEAIEQQEAIKQASEKVEVQKKIVGSVSLDIIKHNLEEINEKFSKSPSSDYAMAVDDFCVELSKKLGIDWYEEEKSVNEFASPFSKQLDDKLTNVITKELTKKINEIPSKQKRGLLVPEKTKSKRKATNQEVEDFMTTETNPKEEKII